MTASRWRPRTAPAIAATPLDDELVLYDERSRQTYLLNRTGSRIWALCDGTRTEVALAHAIATEFGVGYQRARGDVAELVTQLRDAGLLVD